MSWLGLFIVVVVLLIGYFTGTLRLRPTGLLSRTQPDFIAQKPDALLAYLKAWLDAANDFKSDPKKVADVIYTFYTGKGYTMALDTVTEALSRVEVNPGFPTDLQPYMQQQAEILLKNKLINAIPDWSKVLRPEFMERARSGA